MTKISKRNEELVWVILILKNLSLLGNCDLVIGI